VIFKKVYTYREREKFRNLLKHEVIKKNVELMKTKNKYFFELTTSKMTFRHRIVMRERQVVLQNHPKSIRLFEQSENNLTW
jgi:hypothetical protein